jgi:hypothetical protein
MRLPAVLLSMLPLLAHAGPVDGQMDALIDKLGLASKRADAQAACERDAPAARAVLHDPAIERYCLVRHGAPRQHALFLGVQLSAQLAHEGRNDVAEAVDSLMDVLQARPVGEAKF